MTLERWFKVLRESLQASLLLVAGLPIESEDLLQGGIDLQNLVRSVAACVAYGLTESSVM
jgi:hypothetical protein